MPVKNPTTPERRIDPERRRELVRLSTGADAPDGRPARGLAPEDALERWSDPEAYDAMLEYLDARVQVSVATGRKPTPRVLRHQEYRRRRDPLEKKLHAMLEEGRLLATGVGRNADPTAARVIVDPAVFQDVSIGWERDDLRGHTRAYDLELVEIFEPPGVPRNVRVIPDWYWREYEPPTDAPPDPAERPGPDAPLSAGQPTFRHSRDYLHVTIGGTEHVLSPMQARVIEQLHQAFLEGEPWTTSEALLLGAGSDSATLLQLFRRYDRDLLWTLLRSDRRGSYRLNLPDPEGDRG